MELIDSGQGDEGAYSSAVGGLASSETFIGKVTSLLGHETILLVEDETFVRKATAEALESGGYRVLSAESATAALQARCECSEPVDLLLTDVIMPGKNGYELAKEFRFLYPEVHILMMSGYTEQLAGREMSACLTEYMAKPFSVPMLLKRVREVLHGGPSDFRAPA